MPQHRAGLTCLWSFCSSCPVVDGQLRVPQAHSEAVSATEHLKHELASERDRAHKTRLSFTRDLETFVSRTLHSFLCDSGGVLVHLTMIRSLLRPTEQTSPKSRN